MGDPVEDLMQAGALPREEAERVIREAVESFKLEDLPSVQQAVRQETERIAASLKAEAVQRFSTHGGLDPRGAALWDASAAIQEGHLGG